MEACSDIHVRVLAMVTLRDDLPEHLLRLVDNDGEEKLVDLGGEPAVGAQDVVVFRQRFDIPLVHPDC